MNEAIRIALIYGSTRENRFCDKVADWAAAQVTNRRGFLLDVIDPAALSLPYRHESEASAEMNALGSRLDLADAFIIVTPEYNHAYPAAIKFLIDSFNVQWHAKPVAFVSYGGISGGLRAIEQLRLVFAELHAVTVRDTVSFANVWSQFDNDGKLLQPEAAGKAMDIMLGRLQWWATVLREARDSMPYSRVAA